MKTELDRKGLEILVKGSQPHYNEFDNSLIKKAGYDYIRTSWCNLNSLTNDELYKVYLICKNSWK